MKASYKKRLKKYLWFMEDIDFEKDKEIIITQVLNFGTWEDVKLLFKIYGEEEIKKVISNPRRGTFFKKVLNFWKIIFNMDIPEEKFKKAIINLTPEFK